MTIQINALCKMSCLVCLLSSWRKEEFILVNLLSLWRKEGLISVRHFVGQQTSKIIVYQFCTDNPLVKHAQIVIIHVNALYKMGHVYLLSSLRKEGRIFVHLLSSWRKEGLIFVHHFVGQQTSIV